MQFIKNIIYSLSAICLLVSCGEKFFDTTLELPTPDHTPVMAISAFANSTSTDFLNFKVTRTFGLFEERPDNSQDNLSNAEVKLFEDDNLKYTFVEGGNEFEPGYIAPITEMFGGEGKTYKLEVSHPDYGTVTATQVMPEPIPLTDVEFRELSSGGFDGNTGEFRITFSDPPGEENYYELAAQQTVVYSYEQDGVVYEEEYEQEIYLGTDGPPDPNVTQGYDWSTMLISDANFNGQTFTLSAEFYDYTDFGGEGSGETSNYTLYWRTVSKDYFNYSKSLRENINAQDNPFAEPVSLYTNVNGGVGAFCLRSELIYEVE